MGNSLSSLIHSYSQGTCLRLSFLGCIYKQPPNLTCCANCLLSYPCPSMEGAVKSPSSRAMCSLFGSLYVKKHWTHVLGAPLETWGSCCNTSPMSSYVGFDPQVHCRVLRVPLGAVTGVIFNSCITKSCSPDGLSSPVLLIFR